MLFQMQKPFGTQKVYQGFLKSRTCEFISICDYTFFKVYSPCRAIVIKLRNIIYHKRIYMFTFPQKHLSKLA